MKTQRGHITPIERPLGSGSLSERIDTKGELAVFSLTAVLSRVLQNRECRRLIVAASDLWKSGALYKQRPERLSDITDASKFRDSFELCGLSRDPKELRIAVVGWEDDFTVSVCITTLVTTLVMLTLADIADTC